MDFDPRTPVVVRCSSLPSRDETVVRPVLRPADSRLTQQSVGLHSGAEQVSVVSVDVIRFSPSE